MDRALPTSPQLTKVDLETALPKHSVYRSKNGRKEFNQYYDKTIKLLPYPVQQKTVTTRFGDTHICTMGNPNGRRIVILPGMSITGPIMLDFFAYLAKDHLLIAPDLIGQPGRSADTLFSPKKHGYGHWLQDVLDQLEIKKADFAAASFGGSICLDLLAIAPERVGKQALIVTAGLTPKLPYLKIYAKLFMTWMAYRFWPIKKTLRTIARALSRHLTDENLIYLDIVIRQTAFWRHRPAGPFVANNFPNNIEPVFITFSRNDILFPIAHTKPHAEKTLPFAKSFTLEESAHMPSEKEMAPIHNEIETYFKL